MTERVFLEVSANELPEGVADQLRADGFDLRDDVKNEETSEVVVYERDPDAESGYFVKQ